MVKRSALMGGAWVAAVLVAVAVGVLTVMLLASSMKDRGPIGEAVATETPQVTPVVEPANATEAPAPAGEGAQGVVQEQAPSQHQTRAIFAGEFGEYEVGCVGVRASTIDVRPAQGWREVSREAGPDDDVDAVFTDGSREVEVTVFCNRGTPTLDEIEYDTLGSD